MAVANRVLIQLSSVSKYYVMGGETLHALNAVSLDIKQNEYTAIIGASGSGKSTMMNIIGCLDTASEGAYSLDGKNVSGLTGNELAAIRNRKIGFIFQTFNLLPRLTALQNVMQPLIYQRMPLAIRRDRATKMLEKVGLSNRMRHLPSELSGGQRQRVAVARALVTEPSILLADEPTGNLDSTTSAEILNLFDALHAEGQTIVIVTHENDIASRCHRQVRLLDGKIISDERNT